MGQVYTHPDQPNMQVEVVLASQGPEQPPVYTLRLRYPRIIHSEVMTHRMFCRNARSSRAVPVKTMLNELRNGGMFIPWHWGENQKGMQADEECNELVEHGFETVNTDLGPMDLPKYISREEAWRLAGEQAIDAAEAFMEADYHKQLVNRLIEPFTYIDTLITATNWTNFLWLRNHQDAEPHLQDLARLVAQALDEADVKELGAYGWHLPYVHPAEAHQILWEGREAELLASHEIYSIEALRRISAARCARISYAPFDGNASYERELERYEGLVSSDRIHASPMEHQCKPDTWLEHVEGWARPHLHGPLTGYIQFRKTIPGEYKQD